MHILVTGGAGFIGSHIVDAYLEAGHEVAVLDNFSTGRRENLNPQAQLYEGDLRDREFVQKVLTEGKFAVVNHHAAQASVQASLREPAEDAATNIVGTINLLQAAQEHQVKHFIYINTGGALYGEAETLPTPEDYPCDPLTPYGLSKLTAESYLRIFHRAFGLPFTVFRYANIYGPRQHPKGEAGVVAIFAERLLKGETPEIFNDGTNTRDYVYVQDVVAANLKALAKPLNTALNIGTSTQTSVNAIYDVITKILGVELPRQYGRQTIEQKHSCLDYSKAQKLLGWQPQYSLEQGLQETLASYQSRAS